MTEPEWLSCTYSLPMIEFLRGKVCDRKLRLFAVACCRLISPEWNNALSRKAVDVAEMFADGEASREEMAAARAAAPRSYTTYLSNGFPYPDELASSAAAGASAEPIDAVSVVYDAFYSLDMTVGEDGDEVAVQLVRDIFANPFRRTALPFEWLSPVVLALARTSYDGRDFTSLPILADALEEAGCDNPDILDHCRSRGPHVRGCWVVDSILGLKQA